MLTSFSDGRSEHLWGPRQSRPPRLYKMDGPRISQTSVLVPFLFPIPSSIHLSPPESPHRLGGHTFRILLRDLCCTPNFVAHKSVFQKRSEHNQPKIPLFPPEAHQDGRLAGVSAQDPFAAFRAAPQSPAATHRMLVPRSRHLSQIPVHGTKSASAGPLGRTATSWVAQTRDHFLRLLEVRRPGPGPHRWDCRSGPHR